MEDRERIADAIAKTAEYVGRTMSPATIASMAADLGEYDTQDVLHALKRCWRELKVRFSFADILERIPQRGLSVEQAWNIAIEARIWEDGHTIVIPEAIMTAFPLSLWNEGDKVGSRMAFKEAYPKMLEEYGEKVMVSLGFDAEGREPALQEAVRRGLLPAAHAQVLLPHATFTDETPAALPSPRDGEMLQIADGLDLGDILK